MRNTRQLLSEAARLTSITPVDPHLGIIIFAVGFCGVLVGGVVKNRKTIDLSKLEEQHPQQSAAKKKRYVNMVNEIKAYVRYVTRCLLKNGALRDIVYLTDVPQEYWKKLNRARETNQWDFLVDAPMARRFAEKFFTPEQLNPTALPPNTNLDEFCQCLLQPLRAATLARLAPSRKAPFFTEDVPPALVSKLSEAQQSCNGHASHGVGKRTAIAIMDFLSVAPSRSASTNVKVEADSDEANLHGSNQPFNYAYADMADLYDTNQHVNMEGIRWESYHPAPHADVHTPLSAESNEASSTHPSLTQGSIYVLPHSGSFLVQHPILATQNQLFQDSMYSPDELFSDSAPDGTVTSSPSHRGGALEDSYSASPTGSFFLHNVDITCTSQDAWGTSWGVSGCMDGSALCQPCSCCIRL
jgi:hypothetical protein